MWDRALKNIWRRTGGQEHCRPSGGKQTELRLKRCPAHAPGGPEPAEPAVGAPARAVVWGPGPPAGRLGHRGGSPAPVRPRL